MTKTTSTGRARKAESVSSTLFLDCERLRVNMRNIRLFCVCMFVLCCACCVLCCVCVRVCVCVCVCVFVCLCCVLCLCVCVLLVPRKKKARETRETEEEMIYDVNSPLYRGFLASKTESKSAKKRVPYTHNPLSF